MVTGLIILIWCSGVLLALTVIHESGHYIAGLLIGIPAHAMRIRLFTYPPQVALVDDNVLVSPWDYNHYLAIFRRYCTNRFKAIFYVSGGLVGQTVVFILAMIFLIKSGGTKLFLISVTVAVFCKIVSYMLIDCSLTRKRGVPAGDFSALWAISHSAAILVSSVVLLAHGGLLACLLLF